MSGAMRRIGEYLGLLEDTGGTTSTTATTPPTTTACGPEQPGRPGRCRPRIRVRPRRAPTSGGRAPPEW